MVEMLGCWDANEIGQLITGLYQHPPTLAASQEPLLKLMFYHYCVQCGLGNKNIWS